VCTGVNPLCKSSDPQTNDCASCYPGYTLSLGKCIILGNQDKNCNQTLGLSCLSCKDRYYLLNGICTEVRIQCKTYQITTGYCTTCF
jgi:hypothetical protein